MTVTSGGRLIGTTTVNAVDGVAKFADLALLDTGAYSLIFSSPGLTSAGMAVTIVPGPVLSSPGATFATRGLVDPPGQLAPLTNGGVGGPISGLTIASIAYGQSSTGWLKASLLGTTTPANVLLELQLGSLLPGTYTAKVRVRGANTGALDLPVTFVVAGLPPTKLVVATEPVGGASSLATQPMIEFRDSLGFIASQIQDSVTVGIRNGPAYLSGATTIAAVNGIARFTDVRLNSAATFVLSFTARGLPIVTSRPLTITNYPGLFFTSYPLTATSGVRLSPQPVVVALFTTGEADTFLQAFVKLSIKGVGGAKGQLFGTTEMLTVNGVATFTDIGIDGTPGDYILTASEFGGAISNSISYVHIP